MASKYFFSSSSALLLLFTLGCGNGNSQQKKNLSNNSSASSVETRTPNTNYPSAYKGQTRISAVKTSTPYKTEKLAYGLDHPWSIIPFPGNRLLITSKNGYMQLLDANGTLFKKITGLPAVDSRGQGGLLDVALDPSFEKNHSLYWSFSERTGSVNHTAVAKGILNEEKGIIENPVVIFRATPSLNSTYHFGSRLVFDKEGYLFVSTGERFISEGRAKAQDISAGMGKIFRIDTNGKAAPGNPVFNDKNAMPGIYAYGIRNCQSLDINPATGELWEAEFGPRGGDEINIIKPGKNYGWPVITYGLEYSGDPIGEAIQQKQGMEQPIYYWDPSISPSGMTFYKGKAIPEWENNLFIGCLSGSHIVRLVISNNKVVGEERLLADKGERYRDVAYINGMLYTVTDDGSMYRISKK